MKEVPFRMLSIFFAYGGILCSTRTSNGFCQRVIGVILWFSCGEADFFMLHRNCCSVAAAAVVVQLLLNSAVLIYPRHSLKFYVNI